jgi:hypothetical protein
MPARRAATAILGLALGAATMALLPAASRAQEVPETELATPAATVKRGLEAAFSVRELPDGRLLVWDGGARKLVRIDLASGKVDDLMRAGTGDDEVQGALTLLPWLGDSTAAHELAKGRVLIFGPDGSMARSFAVGSPLPQRAPGAPGAMDGGPGAGGQPRLPTARFFAGADRYIGQGFPPPQPRQSPGAAPQRVRYPVVRVALPSLAQDTVVQLLGMQPARAPRPNDAGGMAVPIPTGPLLPTDAWAAYADGTVVVVRSAPYRLEWFAPDGTRRAGEPIPSPAVELSNAIRKEYMDAFRKQTEAARRTNPMMQRITTITFEEPAGWPKLLPPFVATAAPVVDADDRLWIEVPCATSTKHSCVDVIGRDGVRQHRYRFPGDGRVVAVGASGVYYNQQDKGKVVLHRFALP